MSTLARMIWSVAAFAVYGWVNYLVQPVTMQSQNRMATKQFEDSDMSFLQSYYGMDFFHHLGVPVIGLLVVLGLLWYEPVKKFLATFVIVGALAGLSQFAGVEDAQAFATNGSDSVELKGIQPDETAFMVPLFGDTIDNQAQYKPEYLNRPEIKVPGRYVRIPHTKLSGTGGNSGLAAVFGADYWVNSSVLYKVKRAPFSRVWVQEGRGTAKHVDESFPCQTKGGHNVKKIGIAIQTAIEDKNAALYFSVFGPEPLDPKLDLNRIENIFVSERYARSLIAVTDDAVYTKVQQLVCRYIAMQDDPETASAAMNEIMDKVEIDLKAFCASMGITLRVIGWADAWTFDDDVQAAINQKFNAKMVGPYLDVLRANADINLKEGMSAGFRKGMPNFLAVPETLMAPLAAGAAAQVKPVTPPVAPK